MFKKINFSKLKNLLHSLKPNLLKPVNYKLTPKHYTFFIIIFGIIALLLTLFFINQKPTEQPIETTKESPAKSIVGNVAPLAQGKQIYSIRTDKPNNPQVIQVELDPLDVKMGEEQILTVIVKHSEGESITNKNIVTAVYYTDNGSTTAKFKLRRADGPPLIT
ncbi:hypothetical protein D4R86_06075, partial [bacterium]